MRNWTLSPRNRRILEPTAAECAAFGFGLWIGGGRSAGFDPASIAGLTLDLNADVGVTESSGAVSAWANQGSAGGSLTQSTGAAKPTLNATAVNGKKGIVFDGADDWLTSAIGLTTLVTTTAYSAFALMSYQSSTQADTTPYNHTPVLNEPAGPYCSLFSMGGTELAAYHFDSAPKRAIRTIDNAVHVHTQLLSGGTLSLQIDSGTPATTSVAAMSAGAGNVRMGTDYLAAAFAGFKLRRLLVWNVALSAPQIAQVKNYLSTF